MRRAILILAALGLTACDPTTAPDELTLADLPDAPQNSAVVAVTRDLLGVSDVVMQAGQLYFFELRTPPPLPELVFDAFIQSTAPVVRIDLKNATETGTFTTGVDPVEFLFGAPDGTAFEPRSSCRINVTSALSESGIGRLRGNTDCPVTDGARELRVLVKFDHSAG
jgi:hypothetical protein